MQAIDFDLPGILDPNFRLSKYWVNKNIALYFYPKDNTTGCSQQAQDFNAAINAFNQANTTIVGISKDSIKSHVGFKEKFQIAFELLSDTDQVVCKKYDVIKEKSMYGKKYLGIERTTFLIKKGGTIARIWNKVKVPGHVSEILKTLEEI